MTKRAYDKIAEGLQAAIDGKWSTRFRVGDHWATITLADDAPDVWVGRVEGVPGFIVGGSSPFEAERKIREHLAGFLAA